jgi:hypothetical protein
LVARYALCRCPCVAPMIEEETTTHGIRLTIGPRAYAKLRWHNQDTETELIIATEFGGAVSLVLTKDDLTRLVCMIERRLDRL